MAVFVRTQVVLERDRRLLGRLVLTQAPLETPLEPVSVRNGEVAVGYSQFVDGLGRVISHRQLDRPLADALDGEHHCRSPHGIGGVGSHRPRFRSDIGRLDGPRFDRWGPAVGPTTGSLVAAADGPAATPIGAAARRTIQQTTASAFPSIDDPLD